METRCADPSVLLELAGRVEALTAPDRVLFLDIDGVVLNGRALWHTGNNRHLPPEKIALVREVCDRTGCVVVVSSTWRYSDETADMLRAVGLPLHSAWRTDWKHRLVADGYVQRGTEIHRWLARNPVDAYAILDDDSDMLLEQVPYFVKTDHEEGIERWHVDALVEILCGSALPAAQPSPASTPTPESI